MGSSAKKTLAALLLLALALWFALAGPQGVAPVGFDRAVGDTVLARAYRRHWSNVEVQGQGVVLRLLADDLRGSRHQRFILKLPSGQTLLIVHNIDLAPRLDGLRVGDRVAFRGEYEWNAKGGLVHWTHHDPAGRYPGGWLKFQGHTYR